MLLKLTSLSLLTGVLLWANWEAPDMHHFVQPAETVIWQLAAVDSPSVAQALEAQLAKTPGVAACAESPRTGRLALVYHPTEVTPAALYQAVGRTGTRVLTDPPAATAPPTIRACPVPPGYVLLLDQVRFALNLRRFFVTV